MPNEGALDAVLLQQRFDLEKTQISTTIGRIIVFFAFLQSVAQLLHVVDDPGTQTYQNFLCFLSPYLALHVLKTSTPDTYLLIISLALFVLLAFFILKALVGLRMGTMKVFPPKLFQTLQNEYSLVKQVIFVLIHLAIVPVVEILVICISSPIEMMGGRFSFNLNFFNDLIQRVQNGRMYIFLLIIAIANVALYGGFLLMTAMITYPRRFISSNSLANDSKLSVVFFMIKRVPLGMCLFVGMGPNISHTAAIIGSFLLINCLFLAVGYIYPTYYDMKVYELFMSLALVESFFGAIVLFLNAMAYLKVSIWLDSNILVLLMILAYMIASKFQRWLIDCMISLDKESSSINKDLVKYHLVFFKLKGLFDGDQLPEKSDDPFLQNTLSKIRNHFMTCVCNRCFCNKIRSAQTIYDKKNLKKIDFEGVLKEPEGFLRVTSKAYFYKYFVMNKLKMIANQNPQNIELLIYVLKVMIYEFNDFSEATWIFEKLDEMSMSPFQRFELKFMKKSVKQIFSFQHNHKIHNQKFINVEKFHRIYNKFLILENGITLVLRTYLKMITRMSKSKFNALKITEDMEIIHNALEEIRQTAIESKPNIKILTLSFHFVIEFLSDFKLAYELEKKFKQFISIPESIAEFYN